MSPSTYSPSPYVWIPGMGQVPSVRGPWQGTGVALPKRAVSTAERAALKYGLPLPRLGISGLGAPLTGGAAQADSIAATGASATIGILVALGPLSAGVGAAIAGLVALASQIAAIFGGCGQTCVQASNIANQVGDALTQNLNTYLAAPVHYASLQAAALNNFDTAWAALVQACSNPSLQSAGQNCISERQQGACYWKSSPGGWQQQSGKWTYVSPGPAGSGTACWNYFVGMRDPIANDPTVVPDPTSASSTSSASASTSTSSTSASVSGSSPDYTPLLIIAALLGLAVIL